MHPKIRPVVGAILSFIWLVPTTASAVTPTNGGTKNEQPAAKGEDQGKNDVTEKNDKPDSKDDKPKDKTPVNKVGDFNGNEKPLEKSDKEPVKNGAVNVMRSKPEGNVYRVPSKSNYCPAGLQPVTISGEISCGSPNVGIMYQQMMAHPQPSSVKKKRRVINYQSASPSCAVGVKGCSDR